MAQQDNENSTEPRQAQTNADSNAVQEFQSNMNPWHS